jgi:hypothetical protein
MHKGLVSYTQTFRVADIPRDLNIVVLGAYVYTATTVCEYIAKNLPTNLR